MEAEKYGWVIINQNHPFKPNKESIFMETFSRTRKECIAKFVADTASDWHSWYRDWNYRARKAKMIIVVQ